jgi:glycosyltransferase involved in cell wall biosynthesis
MEQNEVMEITLKDHKNLIEKTGKKAAKYDVTTTQSKASEKDNPLITFALFAYNQERFIREAVEGAFSQTYTPLEIILSDDCSSDRTFEIMERMAHDYRGPHNVVLNRNYPNLGLIRHVNKVAIELSHGDIIVMAAGDDISLPQRVYNTWGVFRRDAEIMSASMNFQYIDKNGCSIKKNVNFCEGYFSLCDYINQKEFPIYGCTRSYKKKIFETFGPLASWCGVEDATLVFRSLLLGKSYQLCEIGIQYRVGVNSMSKDINMKTIKGICRQIIIDARKANALNLLDLDNLDRIKSIIRLTLKKNMIRWKCINSKYSLSQYLMRVPFCTDLILKEKIGLLRAVIKNKINFVLNTKKNN